ncbi:MAG: hypothetical protein Ctma_0498 [Catillopecten margaritatus gill symbiont]|uniref:Uncharacterized protein n=1 Tax=Catillopecten margaritatus gill symbiont TaxID=3083288 RepID=A0AAU6PGB0_9GAMM
MADNSITLFVFEGKKQERQYLHIFLEALSLNVNRIEIAFCTHIYTLHKKLEESINLDTFELLKEECTALSPTDYDRDDIARIYLFFDYDGHVPEADDEKIQKMLKVFDNETEKGKLFLSYPMLEALADGVDNFKGANTDISLGRRYKCYKNIRELSQDDLKKATKKHLKKANYLVNKKYQIPSNLIEQSDIFTAQQIKYIVNNEVAILSALPLFYLDYKGVSGISNE